MNQLQASLRFKFGDDYERAAEQYGPVPLKPRMAEAIANRLG